MTNTNQMTANDIQDNQITLCKLHLPRNEKNMQIIHDLRFALAAEFDVPSRDLISKVASYFDLGYEEVRRAL